jgi:hypothetical protein
MAVRATHRAAVDLLLEPSQADPFADELADVGGLATDVVELDDQEIRDAAVAALR